MNESLKNFAKISQKVEQNYKNGCEYLIKILNKIFSVKQLLKISRQVVQKRKALLKFEEITNKLVNADPSTARWSTFSCFSTIVSYTKA